MNVKYLQSYELKDISAFLEGMLENGYQGDVLIQIRGKKITGLKVDTWVQIGAHLP